MLLPKHITVITTGLSSGPDCVPSTIYLLFVFGRSGVIIIKY